MPPESGESSEILRQKKENLKKFITEKCSSIADILLIDKDFFKEIEDYFLLGGKYNLLEDENYKQKIRDYLKNKGITDKQFKNIWDHISSLKHKEIYSYPNLEYFFIGEPSKSKDNDEELPTNLPYNSPEDEGIESYDDYIDTVEQRHDVSVYKEFLLQQASVIKRFDSFTAKSGYPKGKSHKKNKKRFDSFTAKSDYPKRKSHKKNKNNEKDKKLGPKRRLSPQKQIGKETHFQLFNLIDPNCFNLNKFLKNINKNNKNGGEITALGNYLFSISINNFIEFWEFYHKKINIDKAIKDNGRDTLIHSDNNFTSYDIRCGLAHNVTFDRDKNGNWFVKIKVNNRNGEKEAEIDPQFFSNILTLPSSCRNLDCDIMLKGKYGHKQGNRKLITAISRNLWMNNPKDFMNEDSVFSQVLSTTFFDNHFYMQKIWQEFEIRDTIGLINFGDPNDLGNKLGLASITNRPYVHNLISIIATNIFYELSKQQNKKNQNIEYKYIINKIKGNLLKHMYSIENKEKILDFCLDYVNSRLRIQALKTYYINIFKKGGSNDPRNPNYARKNKSKNIDQEKGGENFDKHTKKMTHIRNALAHGRYCIVENDIRMRDVDENDNITRCNRNTNANDETCDTNINNLYEECLKEIGYENDRRMIINAADPITREMELISKKQ